MISLWRRVLQPFHPAPEDHERRTVRREHHEHRQDALIAKKVLTGRDDKIQALLATSMARAPATRHTLTPGATLTIEGGDTIVEIATDTMTTLSVKAITIT